MANFFIGNITPHTGTNWSRYDSANKFAARISIEEAKAV